jgi:ATP-dependent DNA helicase DinG
MKQGAGRLLRGEDDYGVVVLCDPRISSRGYGKTFLDILEPMGTTGDLQEVERFFERHERSGAVA